MKTETEKWEDVVEYFFKYQAINHFPEDRDSLIEKLKPVLDQQIQIAKEEERERWLPIVKLISELVPVDKHNEMFSRLYAHGVDKALVALNNNK